MRAILDKLGIANKQDSSNSDHAEIITLDQINNDGGLLVEDIGPLVDCNFNRDGADLILEGQNGSAIIKDYFNSEHKPLIADSEGHTLSENIIDSFVQSKSIYAQSMSANDQSPVGQVDEIQGDASVTRADGSSSPLSHGMNIYEGDIIETSQEGAVNIVFSDETSFAVSENAKVSIDEYVYDPDSAGEGAQNFSVLKGLFVYTSGLIGREDPDDVNIETPVGSIGIRGTVIAGDVDSGEITVVEGAIVLRDFNGNEVTLANQFETARFNKGGGAIENLGELPASEVATKFSSVSNVAGQLFASINDAANELENNRNAKEQKAQEENVTEGTVEDESAVEDGTIGEGTVEEGTVEQIQDESDEGENAESAEEGQDDQNSEEGQQDSEAGGEEAGDSSDAAGEGEGPAGPGQGANAANGDLTGGLNTQTGDNLANINPQAGGDGPGPGSNGPRGPGQNTTNNADSDNTFDPDDVADPIPNTDQGTDPTGPVFTSRIVNVNKLNGHPDFSVDFVKNIRADLNEAPDSFFKALEGSTFTYDFSRDFKHLDGGSLSFEIDQAGTLSNNSLVDSIDFSNFANNGILSITFADGIASDASLNFKIRAVDDVTGNLSFNNFTNYNFEVLQEDLGTPANNAILNAGNSTYNVVSTSGSNNGTVLINSNNNKVFFTEDIADVDHTITLSNAVSGNLLYLSDQGDNTVTIDGGGSGNSNIIHGGQDNDVIIIEDIANEVYGGGGDDIFILKMDEDEVAGAGNGLFNSADFDKMRIDGAFDSIFGDTLKLSDDTADINLDFSKLNKVSGMERIDLSGGDTDLQGINLAHILDITDSDNTLIFRGDSDNSLTFNSSDFSNFTKSTTAQNDNYDGGSGNTNFDVYTHNGVTLLIEQGIDVSGLPGSV